MTEVENYTDDFFYDGDERTIGKMIIAISWLKVVIFSL